MDKQSKWDSRIDLRPNGIESVLHRKHNAFEIFNTTDVALDNCRVIWDESSRNLYADLVGESGSINTKTSGLTEIVSS
jgi:hypothetical protein